MTWYGGAALDNVEVADQAAEHGAIRLRHPVTGEWSPGKVNFFRVEGLFLRADLCFMHPLVFPRRNAIYQSKDP